MASERQVAANRANALKSTGPRTAAGRAKSSRNAYRHGLSVPIAPDLEEVELLARVIANEAGGDQQPQSAGDDQLEAARALARAQLALKRVRNAKAAAGGLGQILDARVLTELCALDRYERQALSLRKAARRRLDKLGGQDE